MKTLISTILLALPFALSAQNEAYLQVVHNAADPGARVVDVYVNGTLTIDNFEYGKATGFLPLAPGAYSIAVAGPTSTTVSEALATFDVTLEANTNYLAVANGVLTPANFAANPDDVSTAFTLFLKEGVRRTAADNAKVEFIVGHGASDAPAVDVVARVGDGLKLVDNAPYGAITDYLAVDPASYVLDIKPAGAETVVASFTADLSNAAGAAVTVLASGFLTADASNQFGAQFRLLAVFADGTTAFLPSALARLQVIHNAADPGAEVVDIYLNGDLLLNDFEFRTATPFVDVPAYLTQYIGVAGANSTGPADAIATIPVTLAEDGTYLAIANGVLAPANFAANPEERSTGFQLLVKAMARETAATSGNAEFLVVHGATDAPAVDVRLPDGTALVSGAVYGDITDYLSVPPANYTVSITPAGVPTTTVASYNIDLSGAANVAASVLASGFLTSATNQDGPAFGLLVVLPDGTTFLAPTTTSVERVGSTTPGEFRLEGNYPNPFNPSTVIRYELAENATTHLAVYDMLGREIAVLVDQSQPAGNYQVSFDAASLTSGMYLYRLTSGSRSLTGKMMLVK